MNYRLAYWLGFHPWEDAAIDAPFAAKISEMFDREEGDREPPYGSALDIGTGSGIWGIELAKRGWQVTGVDIVDKALRRGRDRAREAGVQMRFVEGDVTALEQSEIDGGFRLVLDTGTFHDFDDAQRRAMGRGVTAVASAEATVLLLVWPKRRRPFIRGVSRAEVEAAFPDWEITHVEPSHFRLPKPLQLLVRPDEHWYRLRRVREVLVQSGSGGSASA
jgi:SAM-dependent methyltransferase